VVAGNGASVHNAAVAMLMQLPRPLLLMLLISVISGALVLSRRPVDDGDLRVWTFTDAHAASFRQSSGDRPPLTQLHEQRTGKRVTVQLLGSRAIDTRLMSLFMSGRMGRALPDLVEIEIGSAGKYFRPPADQIGLPPLNDYLRASGDEGRILPQRLAAWSKDGQIFGIPYDVHPVSLTYRKDLFDEAGVDPAAARTWDDFHKLCLRFEDYWRRRGHVRRAIALPRSNADHLIILLSQRGINLVASDNRVHLRDPRVAQSLAAYVRMIAGEKRIAADPVFSGTLWANDLADGEWCALLTPDWRIDQVKRYAPKLAGKLAMMPLPRFEPSDRPTATWGGTMMGIPRHCADPAESWRLLRLLYLSDEALTARRAHTNVLPPLPEQWKPAYFGGPDPFFGEQDIGALYMDLARQVPVRTVTAFSTLAGQSLSMVLYRAVRDLENDGPEGFEQRCAALLHQAADELERWIAFGTPRERS